MLAKKAEAKFFFTDETTSERFDLFESHTVGRIQGDYQFPDDPRMSGLHGKFTVNESDIRVEDLGSRNGIIINGKKIASGQSVRVYPGDMIEMGNHTFCIGRGGNVPVGSISRIREETSTQVLEKSRPAVVLPETSRPAGPAQVLNIEDLLSNSPNAPRVAPTETPKAPSAAAKPKKKKKKKVEEPSEFAPDSSYLGLKFEKRSAPPEIAPDLDSPPAPPAVFSVLAIMGVLFVAMTAMGVHPVNPMFGDIVYWGANYGPETTNGAWWRLLSSAFVHAGLIQLVASCFAYWQVAIALANVLGAVGILIVFLGAHIVGALTFTALQPEEAGFGAMTGIVGLYGALAVAFLRDRSILDVKARPVLWISVAVLSASNLGVIIRDVADAPSLALAFTSGAILQFVIAPASGYLSVEGPMRFVRPLLAVSLIAGAVVTISGTIAPVNEPSAQVRAVVEMMLPVAERYDRIRAQTKATQETSQELVTAINSEFLPTIRRLRIELEKLPQFKDKRKTAVDSLNMAFNAWERAWTLQAQGLTSDDLYRLEEALDFEAAGFSHFEAAARTLEQWKRRSVR